MAAENATSKSKKINVALADGLSKNEFGQQFYGVYGELSIKFLLLKELLERNQCATHSIPDYVNM